MGPIHSVGCRRCKRPSERLGPLKTRCDEPPHRQDYYRANDSADEPSAFQKLMDGAGKQLLDSLKEAQ